MKESNPKQTTIGESSHIVVTTTPTTTATPISTISGVMIPTVLELDKLEHVEEMVVPLGEYFFSNSRKGIIKGRPKKRKLGSKENEPLGQVMVWNVAEQSLEKVVVETTYALGDFENANA